MANINPSRCQRGHDVGNGSGQTSPVVRMRSRLNKRISECCTPLHWGFCEVSVFLPFDCFFNKLCYWIYHTFYTRRATLFSTCVIFRYYLYVSCTLHTWVRWQCLSPGIVLTMPIDFIGLGLLRSLLPALTPYVNKEYNGGIFFYRVHSLNWLYFTIVFYTGIVIQ